MLHGLEQGDSTLKLPPATDPEIISGLVAVRQSWNPIHDALVQVISAKPAQRESLLAPVLYGNMELLTRMDEVVKLFEHRSQEKVTATSRFQVSTTIVMLAVLLVIWLVVQRSLILPILGAIEYLRILASGNLTSRQTSSQKSQSKDEVGVMLEALGSMQQSLHATVSQVASAAEKWQVAVRT